MVSATARRTRSGGSTRATGGRAGRARAAALPGVEQREPLRPAQRAFVGEVVGHAGERVDRRHVRPHRARKQPRRDREVLVVLARETLAVRVGGREPGRD